jgi:pimeloyl-ACP methyl ester carboxylesterase
MDTTPFRIDVPQATLDDLRSRLERTRWPDTPADLGWGAGTDIDLMHRLVEHWLDGYDWRRQEAVLNRFPQLIADVDGTRIHAIHARGKGPAPIPLLLAHGYPDTFDRFAKVVPLLTDPAAHGLPDDLTFDVVVPSLPGFGYSDHTPMGTEGMARTLHGLMEGLGYERFIAGGGDGPVPMAMARQRPEAMLGIYVIDVGYPDGSIDPGTLTPPEQEFAAWIGSWWMREGAFNMIQSTKPQSLAYALNDSPTGLAAWLMILYASGGPERLEERFTLDDLITNAMVHWVSGDIGSAMRMYQQTAMERYAYPSAPRPGRSEVPAGMARMPLDAPVPREWAERQVNLVYWSEPERGGHHSSMEVPDVFADDLRSFVRVLRSES